MFLYRCGYLLKAGYFMTANCVASYIGDNKVVVAPKVKTGNLGDGGKVQTFASPEAAKAYADLVNKTGTDAYQQTVTASQGEPVRHEGDAFVKS